MDGQQAGGRSDLAGLLHRVADEVAAFRDGLPERHVAALDPDETRARFAVPLDDGPLTPDEVVARLVAAAEPGLVATVGPRFFGFVIGGALEAATAADMLAAGWDQCGFNEALSPAAMAAEAAAATWLKEILGLPSTASVGFATGAQEANTVGLAAGRHHVLAEVGWDVEARGLHGAPQLRVVAGAERHATIDRSLRLLGIGTGVIEAIAVDDNGAMDTDDLARVLAARPPGPTLVCLQAGNVNTGAIDDLRRGAEVAHAHGAWVHVDGAFGLWAAASPITRHLVDGIDLADSWGCDGHKWLNVPYDSAYAICAHPEVHAAAVSYTAAYLTGAAGNATVGADVTLSSSRRARGFATWAALRQLGRRGPGEVVERCCGLARRFAEGLEAGGMRVVNEVVLNQVLVDVGDGQDVDGLVGRIQQDGTCWIGATTWRRQRLLRVSVSNATTTEDDVDRSVAAILRCAEDGRARGRGRSPQEP